MDDLQDKKKYETEIYQEWIDKGCFKPKYNFDKNFSICIPPPNVTGSLHMGHALNNTIQDILVRYHRMNGYNTLWQPGTDHAGIATQMVVERNLEEKNIYRKDLSREEFIKKVWEWKEYSGSTIINQLKRLGSSCDWSRERFTMDEGLSSAVRKVFVSLYNEGLIYKGQTLVNWDTKFKTAISDLEAFRSITPFRMKAVRRDSIRKERPCPGSVSGGRPGRWKLNRVRWCVFPGLFLSPLRLRSRSCLEVRSCTGGRRSPEPGFSGLRRMSPRLRALP